MDRSRSTSATLVWDVGPAFVLVVLGLLTNSDRTSRDLVASLVVVLPLLFRRTWPFATFAIVAGLAVATSTHVSEPWVQVGAVLLASFTTGLLGGDRARSALGTIAVAGLMTLGFVLQDGEPVQSLVLPFVVVVPAWLVGDVIREQRLTTRRRDEAAAEALAEAEERAATAAADERRHMARELHDIVAHGVSVMLVQAGAARQVVETAPDRAIDSLLTVEATGRDVMAELRHMLGALNDEGEAAAVGPQPGVDQLEALVDRVREAGLPAQLEIDGTPAALAANLDVTAYRIVQEALTNALRYARRAATLVRVSYDPEQLRLEILDDGPGTGDDAGDGSGRGLVGMRERAALVGGRLEAGPRLGGGYAVRAWLPLEQAGS